MKKLIIICCILFAIFVIGLLALYFTLTSSLIKNVILSKVNENINGNVIADDISLSLIDGITLRKVQVKDKNDKELLAFDYFNADLRLRIPGNLASGFTVNSHLTRRFACMGCSVPWRWL